MRRPLCWLPGLLVLGVCFWSVALGLGSLSLTWLLFGPESELTSAFDEDWDDVASAPAPSPRQEVVASCFLLASERAEPGEVQRWRISDCDRAADARATGEPVLIDQLGPVSNPDFPYGRTAF